MIKTKYSDITKEEIELALKLLKEKKDMSFIKRMTKLNHNDILSIALNNGIEVTRNQLPFCRIEDQDILVYSDYHRGGIYERPTYKTKMLQYAKNHGIRTLFNCGDEFQSNIEPFYDDVEHQTNSYELSMVEKHLTTYWCGGNHDLDALIKHPALGEVIEGRKDIIFVGFKIAYFDWLKHLTSMYHPINNFDIRIPKVESEIIFSGHHHDYQKKHFKSKSGLIRTEIYVPPCCDDTKMLGSPPGFLVASIVNNKLTIRLNTFSRDPKSEEGATINETVDKYSIKLKR